MTWNWEQPGWPNFTWRSSEVQAAERRFLLGAGVLVGAVKHLDPEQHGQLMVEAMSGEALTTSKIEGEVLNRSSVQSSIQRQLGLATHSRRIPPAEQGISEMMVALYRAVPDPLSEHMLFSWHRMMAAGRTDLREIGCYRTSREPMQVISGPMGATRTHFEAPPSKRVPAEMKRFIQWFNRTAPDGAEPMPALTRAGIAHLYFESIHPFEDGNGRIGRAISEKALAQGFGRPVLVALATAILAHQKDYYVQLEKANKQNEVSTWLAWFSAIVLEAQQSTLTQVEFIIAKTRFLDRLRGQINGRQQKALLRMLQEGPQGFRGGLSAGKYSTVTGASPATATRDLADLLSKGALRRTGELKHTRYTLNLPQTPFAEND